jgi:hypothetical protein
MVLAAVVPIASAQSVWRMVPALESRRTGTLRDSDLSESSGVAASRRHPGVLWSINDSGHPASLFATDTLGRSLGVIAVTGARNVDWEAVAAGPCEAPQGTCLYIADTGDNRERRESVRLYRVPEPAVGPGAPRATARAAALRVRYPGGPRDVEAVFVDGGGAVHLVSKGWDRVVHHYRVPAAAWRRGEATAEAMDSLPLAVGRAAGRLVTDAAVSPDGSIVAVRTYAEVFLFRLAPDGELVAGARVACELGALDLLGEGIDWLDSHRLVLTSEGVLGTAGTVSVARCPAG